MFDPPVHFHKTILMQRILDVVSRGYEQYTSGVVPTHKAAQLYDKFAERYGVHFNANQRAYAKRKGKSNARLFFLYQDGSKDLSWWLLVSKGTGSVHELEQLSYALDKRKRIRIGEDYELVRRTRSSAKGGGAVWSWRMTHCCYERWRERLIAISRSKDAFKTTQAVGSLYRTPGFSGVRHQVGKLVTFLRHQWRRRHGNLDNLVLQPKLPYLERLSDTTVPLSQLTNDG